MLTEKDVEDCLIGRQSSPSSSLPIDTEIYNSVLYYSTEKGLFSATAHRPKSEKYKVSTKPRKLWDARVLTITANDYPQMAISAGSDGLYEFRPGIEHRIPVLQEIEPQLYRVSERFSLFSNYMYEKAFSAPPEMGIHTFQCLSWIETTIHSIVFMKRKWKSVHLLLTR